MFHPYLIALLTLLLLSLTARAQCPGGASFTGPEIPGVNSNQITAMLDWDPDGAGPLPSRLLVSGDFTLAGSVAAGGMATWDGSEWAAFPVPLASVNALTTFDGDLIAAPANANPAPVVRWDAAAGAWQPMGSTLLAPVNALAVFNSQLYAGGTGLRPGIGGLRPVARWNGTAWQGVTTLSYGTIHALHVYNNLLYLGGGESTGSLIVAAFNGSSTTTYPINCGCAVRSFATHNGLLYMGTTGFNPVKVFDGTTWQSANFGVFTYTTTPAVYSMRSFDGDLYVGGDFVTSYAGSEVNNLARLRNGTWQQIHPHGSCFSKVLSLVPFQHVLVIGTSTSDDLSSPSGIAAYGAGGLSALSSALDGFVAAAVNFDNGTVYAGSFMRAGAAILNGAGRYAAGDWTPIGDGPGIASQHAVVHNGDLYVAGLGLDLPGLPVRRWDGAAWSTLGTGTQRFASIQGLESLNGDLFVAGIFSQANGVDARGVARWDGSAWHPVGTFQGEVYATTVHENRLIVGGQISQLGNIAAWNGSVWQSLGSGLNQWPSALTIYRGNIIAAGNFTASGATTLNHVARFDGGAWQPVGPGFSGSVYALSEYDNRLFLLGRLPTAPYLSVLLAWDGQTWTDVTPPSLAATWRPVNLAVVNNRLLIFDYAGFGVIEFTQSCGPICGSADFNNDGDSGTDADIEAFFACLGGNCCTECFPGGADFNADGDVGTDADIESFFRVLAGGNC